jgi:imidazole glycerol phosphate synthase subunit HisF
VHSTRWQTGEILLTSMDTDGVQEGFDCELTRAISCATHIPVIASGGAGKPEHFLRVFEEGQADAVEAQSLFQLAEGGEVGHRIRQPEPARNRLMTGGESGVLFPGLQLS